MPKSEKECIVTIELHRDVTVTVTAGDKPSEMILIAVKSPYKRHATMIHAYVGLHTTHK